MWWKEPGLWHVTQWLCSSEPLLLFHGVVGLLGGSQEPWVRWTQRGISPLIVKASAGRAPPTRPDPAHLPHLGTWGNLFVLQGVWWGFKLEILPELSPGFYSLFRHSLSLYRSAKHP